MTSNAGFTVVLFWQVTGIIHASVFMFTILYSVAILDFVVIFVCARFLASWYYVCRLTGIRVLVLLNGHS